MNCQFCGSRIFDSDRVCERCGAPNLSIEFVKEDTFGKWMQEIESFAPQDCNYETIEVHGGRGNALLYTYSHIK